eukprot:3374429-Prymnesium_polylepis.1
MCPCVRSASSTSSGPASSFRALSRAQSRSVSASGGSGAAEIVCGIAAAARGSAAFCPRIASGRQLVASCRSPVGRQS